MFKLTRKSEYALIALRHLQMNHDALSSSKAISQMYMIPREILAKVLQTLARHQIIESHHNGPKGGYVLGRAPKDITIAQVLEAIEGPLGITDCYHEKEDSSCDQMDRCNIRTPLLKIQESIYQLLNGMSIEDMLLEESPLVIVESLKPQGANT